MRFGLSHEEYIVTFRKSLAAGNVYNVLQMRKPLSKAGNHTAGEEDI